MKPEGDHPATAAASLRDRAEAALRKRANAAPEALAALAPEATRALLHELQVHQIELELQNEELRGAQHALEVSRARYFDLYDLAPVGYCTVSDAGLIVEANLTLAELLGAPRSVVVTRPLSRFILKEDQDLFYHLRQRVKAAATQALDGPAMSCELRFLRTDASHFWAHLTATVESDARLRVVVTDITTRKAAEATRVLLESELVQAQKMESVGRLAGGVAHDFNNMLTVILGNVELAFGEVDAGSPLHQDLVDIRTAAQRSAELTAQLLAYARKQVIAPKVLDLNATVADTVTLLRRLVSEDVQLVWKPGADLWPVKMDASQVTQILTNLVVNARDAIAAGGTITIETQNRSDGACACVEGACRGRDGYVSLIVTDDGCGMNDETLAHLFEPFFTTKALGNGTGLGLAMVFGAVKQNHGFVNVRSAPGAGTTFTVCLRRHEEAPALRGGTSATSAREAWPRDHPVGRR